MAMGEVAEPSLLYHSWEKMGETVQKRGAIRRKRGGGPENEIHCRVIVKKIKSSVHIYRKPMLMRLGVFWNFSAFSCGFVFFRGGG